MGLCTLNVPLFYSVHCSCSLCKHSHPSIGTCGVAVTWDQACLILKATTVGSLSLPHGLIQWSLFSSHLTKYSYLPSFMKFFFCFKVQLFPDFSASEIGFPLALLTFSTVCPYCPATGAFVPSMLLPIFSVFFLISSLPPSLRLQLPWNIVNSDLLLPPTGELLDSTV